MAIWIHNTLFNLWDCKLASCEKNISFDRENRREGLNSIFWNDLRLKLKGKRVFLDELPTDAKGGKIKSYECGIFCDTK